MSRVAERLTDAKARTARVAHGSKMLADGKGLYLKIGASGSRSWVFRYVIGGRQHDMGLGPYPDVPLATARERALEQRRLRLDGKDPITERRRAAPVASVTFKSAAEAYIAANESGWRGKTEVHQ